MKRTNLNKTLIAATLLGGIFAAVSFSANAGDDAGKSRIQVKAELAESKRAEHFDWRTESLVPNRIEPAMAPLTRGQVKAELAESKRTEHFDWRTESLVPNQIVLAMAPLTRSQVKADLAQFRRTHHFDWNTESYMPHK